MLWLLMPLGPEYGGNQTLYPGFALAHPGPNFISVCPTRPSTSTSGFLIFRLFHSIH